MQRDPARLLVDDLARGRVALPRGAEDGPSVVGRRKRAPPGSRADPSLGELRKRVGAGVELVAEPRADEVELSGGAVVAAVELAAEDDAAAEAGSRRGSRGRRLSRRRNDPPDDTRGVRVAGHGMSARRTA